jgi:uncharacterized membrane protein
MLLEKNGTFQKGFNVKKMPTTKQCFLCGKNKNISELVSSEFVNDYLLAMIKSKHQDWGNESLICKEDLNQYRTLYVREALAKDRGEISDLENDVLKSLNEYEIVADNLNRQFDQHTSFGDKISDKMASFGGSWRFIIIFCSLLALWIVLNSRTLFVHSFDPYPFILLNLVLSFIAALQAPIIMMSQNRQEAKDRLRAEMDYKINLKAELEIRHLKAKLDQLASHQWQRLMEIQELQTELIEDLSKHQSLE